MGKSNARNSPQVQYKEYLSSYLSLIAKQTDMHLIPAGRMKPGLKLTEADIKNYLLNKCDVALALIQKLNARLNETIAEPYIFTKVKKAHVKTQETKILASDAFFEYVQGAPYLQPLYFAILITQCRTWCVEEGSSLLQMSSNSEIIDIDLIEVIAKFLKFYPQMHTYLASQEKSIAALAELRENIIRFLAVIKRNCAETNKSRLFNELFADYEEDLLQSERYKLLLDRYNSIISASPINFDDLKSVVDDIEKNNANLSLKTRIIIYKSVAEEALASIKPTMSEQGRKELLLTHIHYISRVVDAISNHRDQTFERANLACIFSVIPNYFLSLYSLDESYLSFLLFIVLEVDQDQENKQAISYEKQKFVRGVLARLVLKIALTDDQISERILAGDSNDQDKLTSLQEELTQLRKIEQMFQHLTADKLPVKSKPLLSQATLQDRERQFEQLTIKKQAEEVSAASGSGVRPKTSKWEGHYYDLKNEAAALTSHPNYNKASALMEQAMLLAATHKDTFKVYEAQVIRYHYQLMRLEYLLKKLDETLIPIETEYERDKETARYTLEASEQEVRHNGRQAYRLTQDYHRYEEIYYIFRLIDKLEKSINLPESDIPEESVQTRLKLDQTKQELKNYFAEKVDFVQHFFSSTQLQHGLYSKPKPRVEWSAAAQEAKPGPFFLLKQLFRKIQDDGSVPHVSSVTQDSLPVYFIDKLSALEQQLKYSDSLECHEEDELSLPPAAIPQLEEVKESGNELIPPDPSPQEIYHQFHNSSIIHILVLHDLKLSEEQEIMIGEFIQTHEWYTDSKRDALLFTLAQGAKDSPVEEILKHAIGSGKYSQLNEEEVLIRYKRDDLFYRALCSAAYTSEYFGFDQLQGFCQLVNEHTDKLSPEQQQILLFQVEELYLTETTKRADQFSHELFSMAIYNMLSSLISVSSSEVNVDLGEAIKGITNLNSFWPKPSLPPVIELGINSQPEASSSPVSRKKIRGKRGGVHNRPRSNYPSQTDVTCLSQNPHTSWNSLAASSVAQATNSTYQAASSNSQGGRVFRQAPYSAIASAQQGQVNMPPAVTHASLVFGQVTILRRPVPSVLNISAPTFSPGASTKADSALPELEQLRPLRQSNGR